MIEKFSLAQSRDGNPPYAFNGCGGKFPPVHSIGLEEWDDVRGHMNLLRIAPVGDSIDLCPIDPVCCDQGCLSYHPVK